MSITHIDEKSKRLHVVKDEMMRTERLEKPSDPEDDEWYQCIQDPSGQVSWRRADLVNEYGALQRELRGY